MKLQAIDLSIICIYLVSTILIGLYLKKRAGENLKTYFQGGKKIPWYLLGISNASGMFDISGTMWLVTLCVVYGMKSIWIPWLWPVFNQVFLAVYLSIWLRRSNVLTGAEWIRTRFGDGIGGRLSHMVVVLFAIISVVGFLSYGFIGIGKFMEIFIPWSSVSAYIPFSVSAEYVPHFYGLFFTSIATFYVMMGGMLSIVWTDVLQFFIMTLSALIIGVIAINNVSHEELLTATPHGWSHPFFGWTLDINWSGLIDELNDKVLSDGYSLFSVFFMMMLFKGVLVSAAGPAPNYDMQKILATRSPRESALMSALVSIVLMPIRYFMVAGFAVLAIVFYQDLDLTVGGTLDFESILPAAILQFVPVGVTGLLLAGLLAAFMSTFASTVNAAPAYLVNDIYKRYINPSASNKRLIYASYLASVLVVLVSSLIGLYIESINSVLQWLVSGLWGGYAVSNVLKWYWWRLNGIGYFGGMMAGIIGAMLFPVLFHHFFPGVATDILPLYLFPLLLVFSATVCIVTSVLTPAEDKQLLKHFYRTVRPWGFWSPVAQWVKNEDPNFQVNTQFRRDMKNVVVGVIAQTVLVALPVLIVMREIQSALLSIAILLIAIIYLKKYWYEPLNEHSEEPQ